jgi:hypothetical protein
MIYDYQYFDETMDSYIINYFFSNKSCVNNYPNINPDFDRVHFYDYFICHRSKLIFSGSISLEFLLNNLLTIDFIFILKYPLMSNK